MVEIGDIIQDGDEYGIVTQIVSPNFAYILFSQGETKRWTPYFKIVCSYSDLAATLYLTATQQYRYATIQYQTRFYGSDKVIY